MKEALNSPYPKLIKRITFNDESTVRRNGGTPTDVTFENGVGRFNGTDSSAVDPNITKINYSIPLNGTYSVRIKFNVTDFNTIRTLLDTRASNNDGVGVIYFYESTGLLTITSGTAYINNVVTTSVVAGKDNDLIVSGISLKQGTGANLILLGCLYTNRFGFKGTMDLVEIYQGTLTASEVKNLYENKWNKEQSFGGDFKTNIIKNGDFENGSDDWDLVLGCVISNNSLVFDGLSNFPNATQSNVFEANKTYRITVDVTVESGLMYIYAGNSSNGATARLLGITSSGSKEIIVTSLFSGNMQILGWGYFSGSIDNVTVQELQPDLLLDFDSTRGVLENKQEGRVLNTVINNDFDFTTWNTVTAVANNNNTFTTTSSGGVFISGVTEIGKRYKFIIKGTTTANTIHIRNASESTIYKVITPVGGNFSEIAEFTAAATNFWVNNTSAGVTTITELILQKIQPALTPTDVSIKKIGQSYSADFNGTTSLIDTGSDMIGTKAVTVCGWINPKGWGEGVGDIKALIFYNGKTGLLLDEINGRLRFTSNETITANSNNTSISLSKYLFFSVTRTAAGVGNIYLADLSNAPALSGNANQNSGTPIAGSTNVIIGNNSGATRTFDGNISELKVVEGILDLQTITQIWSSTRKNYI